MWLNETRLIKNRRGTRILFSHHGLHPRIQAIKLLPSLTYPLKTIKGQSNSCPTTHHDLLLIDIQHDVRLKGVCRCGWHQELQHLKLLLKGGNHCCPHLELEIPLLLSLLKVYDRKGALIHHLTSGV
jgi:hypothetical protein